MRLHSQSVLSLIIMLGPPDRPPRRQPVSTVAPIGEKGLFRVKVEP